MKISGVKMALMLLFIIVMTGCFNTLSPKSDTAGLTGKEFNAVPRERTRVQGDNESPTGEGAVTDTGKLLAVYKYSGGVMVGVEGKNWYLSVSGGGVPTMLTITDPTRGTKRTYRYSEDDWRKDPVVQSGNLETLIAGIVKDIQNTKIQDDIRRTQERQINPIAPKNNPSVPNYTPPSNIQPQPYVPPRSPTVPTVPSTPGIPGR